MNRGTRERYRLQYEIVVGSPGLTIVLDHMCANTICVSKVLCTLEQFTILSISLQFLCEHE